MINEDLKHKKTFEALEVLSEACKMDPSNAQLKFQRVRVLLSMKNDEEALAVIQALSQTWHNLTRNCNPNMSQLNPKL